ADEMQRVSKAASVTHQATRRGVITQIVNCRNAGLRCKGHDLIASAQEKWIGLYNDGTAALFNDGPKSRFYFVPGGGFDDNQLFFQTSRCGARIVGVERRNRIVLIHKEGDGI